MFTESSFPFYLCIIFISVLLMFFSQVWKNGTLVKFKKIWFFSSFLPLWYVSAFTNSGADYSQYAYICNNATIQLQETYIEFGWNALSFILTSIFENPYKALFIIQSLTLTIYIYAFYIIRKEVSLWLSLLAFEIFLFFNFGLMSIYLSIALVFLSVIKYIHNKKKTSIVLIFIASSFHSTALFYLPVYALLILVNKFNLSLKKIFLILSLIIVILIATIEVLYPLLFKISSFQQYSNYVFEDKISLRLGNIILYITYCFMLVDYFKSKDSLCNKRLLLILISLLFICMLLGYMIPTVTRMKFYAIFITALFIPKSLNIKSHSYKKIIWFLFIILFGGLELYKTIMTENYQMTIWNYFNPW